MPPPRAEHWAVANEFNKPLAGLSDKTFAELEQMTMAELREMLTRKAELTGYVPFQAEQDARDAYGGP